MSFPRYPAYKDSGVEWLGEVPAHWDVLRGRFIYQQASRVPEDGDGVVTAFRDGEVTLRENRRLDGFTVAILEVGYQRVLAGDLVINGMDAFAGAIGVSDSTGKCSPEYSVLTASHSGTSNRYFAHSLRVMAERDYVYVICPSVRERAPRFRFESFRDVLLPVPPTTEQQAIAAFLDRETSKIDALVAEQERLIELLKEKRQAVISHAVTKGLNPDAPMKDSGAARLGSIPQHWRLLPLKYIARVGNGSTPSRETPSYWAESGVPWLNSGVVNEDEVRDSDQFVTEFALKDCHLPVVKAPAVLVGITGQGRTRGMAATLLFDATVSQHVAYILPDTHQASARWVRRFLDANYQSLREDSEEGGSTKAAITCEQLGLLRIPLPPPDEQTHIIDRLDSELVRLNGLTNEAAQAIELLRERRAALISAAVTGQIDVRPESLRTAA